ncbi:hypothetical protein TNCT_108241 [Trichonephila clavata]|uniref:Uncharacterized protein n=1 Tax=Trichonephila clavata TaxID=2740835 RepID=A0A8X6GDJ5_TRICU|nr:hypothetical protein TNCT_108241 [Trichonephila clavata]
MRKVCATIGHCIMTTRQATHCTHCLQVAGQNECGNVAPAPIHNQSGISKLLFVQKDQKNPERNLAWDAGSGTGSPFFAQ